MRSAAHFPCSRSLLFWIGLLLLSACGDDTSPPKPNALELVAGDAQMDTVGATLATPLRIRVLDERGRPLANHAVAWTVSAGDAVVTPLAAVTDAEGGSSATVKLGTVAGDVRVVASVGTQHTMTFSATSTAGKPKTASASVTAVHFAALADTARIQLIVKDRAGNAIDSAQVQWSSSDPAIVTFPSAGVAVSLKPGSTTVSAAVAGGPTVTLPATVSQEIAAVGIGAGTRTFTAVGDTMRLSARALDSNDFEVQGAPLRWSSSDTTVLQVDSTGLVRAAGAGSANIFVRSAAATASTSISVIQDAAEVNIAQDSFSLAAFADTVRATATSRDRNGYLIENAAIVWTVSDTAIATVNSSGLVTSRGNGSAEVIASYDGVSASAGVRVNQIATSVLVTPEENALHALQDTAHFSAAAFDANEFAIDSAVFSWQSSDTTIAVVTAEGRVISQAPGETEISATLDGSTGTAVVLIDQVPASVSLTPPELTLSALEDTAQLVAVAYDSMGHVIADAIFSWLSENTSIADVDENGLVTGQTPGTTTVTAAIGEVSGSSTVTVKQAPARVTLAPANVTITAVEDTAHLGVTAYDANGNVIEDAAFTWSIADETIATVDAQGIVMSRRGGETTVTVRSGQAKDQGTVRVVQRAVNVSLETPEDTVRADPHTIQLVATAWDRNGYEVTGREFSWRSLRTSYVRVNDSGVVRAGSSRGAARIVATMDGEADTVEITHMPYGVLVLTFDDAYESAYTRVLPLLKQYGIRANLAVPTGLVGTFGRLTLTEIKAFHNAGWSILPHSVTHPDLSSLSREAMEEEIGDSQEWVRNQGFRGSSIFVVPLHRWGNREKDVISRRFVAARGYGVDHPSHGGMVDWPPADPYALTAIPGDEYYLTEEGRAQMELWWIEAITKGKFLGTYIHDVDEEDLPAFKKMLERLVKYRDRIHTYSDLFE